MTNTLTLTPSPSARTSLSTYEECVHAKVDATETHPETNNAGARQSDPHGKLDAGERDMLTRAKAESVWYERRIVDERVEPRRVECRPRTLHASTESRILVRN